MRDILTYGYEIPDDRLRIFEWMLMDQNYEEGYC